MVGGAFTKGQEVSLLKVHGGKSYLAKWIVEQFPKDGWCHYVEPYFGGGSVLFALPDGERSEVVNDLNGSVSAFWRCVRDQAGDLVKVLETVPFSEVEFRQAQEVLAGECDTFARAVAFMVANRQSRQGLGRSFATLSRRRTRRGVNEQASSWLTAIEQVAWFRERLRAVVILDRPAIDVIKQQDGEETLFYLDPPYLHSTRTAKKAYDCEMSDGDHVELLQVLENVKGRFLLSGYDSEIYREFEQRNGWKRSEKEIDNKSATVKKGMEAKEKRIEIVWKNF